MHMSAVHMGAIGISPGIEVTGDSELPNVSSVH